MTCEIHQFHLHFHMAFFSFAHWRFVFSKIRRRTYCVWAVSRVLLGRTSVFGLRTKKPKALKTLEPFLKAYVSPAHLLRRLENDRDHDPRTTTLENRL